MSGSNPEAVAVSPDGAAVLVTNFQPGTVGVIDTATNTLSTTIAVGAAPDAVAFTPDGMAAYVVNFGSQTLSVIDTASARVTRTIDLPDGGEGIAVGLVPGGCVAPPPIPTPTLTPTAPPCVGDCDRNGLVTAADLMLGLNIALGRSTAAQCSLLDTSGDGVVTVDELLAAMNRALELCPL